jgi:hypothetical protein
MCYSFWKHGAIGKVDLGVSQEGAELSSFRLSIQYLKH